MKNSSFAVYRVSADWGGWYASWTDLQASASAAGACPSGQMCFESTRGSQGVGFGPEAVAADTELRFQPLDAGIKVPLVAESE